MRQLPLDESIAANELSESAVQNAYAAYLRAGGTSADRDTFQLAAQRATLAATLTMRGKMTVAKQGRAYAKARDVALATFRLTAL